MGVYKDKNGTWFVQTRYKDWQGENKQKCKRGFKTKREAKEWERDFLQKTAGDMNMTFGAFVELYESDMKLQLRSSTWKTKENIIQNWITPYFEKRKVNEITAKDILKWQNEVRSAVGKDGKPLSQGYLKTIHNQLSAIFNHGCKFYGLRMNPAARAGNMGKEEKKEMNFWTKDEYLQFAEMVMDNPRVYYTFEMLYWSGLRIGEVEALTPSDFNFERETVSVTKTHKVEDGVHFDTPPKTPKSVRVVQLPHFLCEEIKDYMAMYYSLDSDSRLFTVSTSSLRRHVNKCSEALGLVRLRLHDFRHSHVSLLANMGFTMFEVGERMGHESEEITARYAHMFPGVQQRMAEKMDVARWEKGESKHDSEEHG